MRTPIKLYCDKVYNNGDNGETYSSHNIYENLKSIGNELFEEFTDSFAEHSASSFFAHAGRFIVIVSMTFEIEQQGMVIMDLKKDMEVAYTIAKNKGGDQSEIDKFMDAFYEGLKTYDTDFDKFILEERAL